MPVAASAREMAWRRWDYVASVVASVRSSAGCGCIKCRYCYLWTAVAMNSDKKILRVSVIVDHMTRLRRACSSLSSDQEEQAAAYYQSE